MRISAKYSHAPIVASSVGSLTNPSKIQKTFASVRGTAIADDTISRYLGYFMVLLGLSS